MRAFLSAAVLLLQGSIVLAGSPPLDQASPYKSLAEFTRTIAAPADQAWRALLLALQQSLMRVRVLDNDRMRLTTYPIDLPASDTRNRGRTELDQARGQRFPPRASSALKLVVSRQTHYSFAVAVTPAGTGTSVTVRSTLLYSTGQKENALLSKIEENLSKAAGQAGLMPTPEVDLLIPYARPSGTAEHRYAADFDSVWGLLQRILKDEGVKVEGVHRQSGLLVSELIPLSPAEQQTLMTKELLDQDKRGFSVSGPSRVRLCFRVVGVQPPEIGSLVRLETSFERSESSVASAWHAFASSGTLENRLLGVVADILKARSPLDQYDFANLRVTPVRSRTLRSVPTKLWTSTVFALRQEGFKVKNLREDVKTRVFVTEWQPDQDVRTALQCSLRKLDEASSELSVGVARIRGSGLGTEYLAAAEVADRFLNLVERNLSQKRPEALKEVAEMDASMRGGNFSEVELASVLDFLKAAQIIRLVPRFEFYDRGIRLRDTQGNGKALSLAIHAIDPFESERPLTESQISRLIVDQLITHLGFALSVNLPRLAEITSVQIRVAFRFYNLDEGAPLDLQYHAIQIELPVPRLLQNIEGEIDSAALLKYCSVQLDGKPIEVGAL